MSIIDIPFAIRTILLILSYAEILFAAFEIFTVTRNRRPVYRIITPVLVSLAGYFAQICLAVAITVITGRELGKDEEFFSHCISGTLLIILIVFTFVLEIVSFIENYHYENSHLSELSVKEGMDKIKTGLCYYYPDGRVKLENPIIEKISQDVLGITIKNGLIFWAKINAKDGLVHLSDGTVYSIKRNELNYDGQILYEIIASDVTEEEKQLKTLSKKEEELRVFNEHLRKFDSAVNENIYAREILEAKIKVHDELGLALLKMRHYMETGSQDDNELDEIRQMWKKIRLMDLEEDKNEDIDNLLKDVNEAANAIGIKMIVRGDVSSLDTRLQKHLAAGAREYLTNAVRHAKASEVIITLEQEQIIYEDNGNIKVKEYVEGSGLGSLRHIVEGEGLKMEVLVEPKFRLIIEV